MVINKTRIYIMTVVAFLFYIFLEYAVDEDPFFGDMTGDFWPDGAWIRWVGALAILVLGFWQASQLGDKEIDITTRRNDDTPGQVDDPSFWKALTGNVYMSVLWLPLRLVLGIHWLQAGWHKTQEAGWALSGEGMVRQADGTMAPGFLERGQSMEGFLRGAYTPNPETGATKAVFGWYANVLEFIVDNGWTSWLGPMIAWGEVLVGLGLILGGLIGFAAFFGTVMNMSFMLAGTVSANPWMFAMTVFIIIGWKVAGYLGLDRWLLPMLGTPWNRNVDARPHNTATVTTTNDTTAPTIKH